MSNCIVDNGYINKDINTGDYRDITLYKSPFNFEDNSLEKIKDVKFDTYKEEMCLWTKEKIKMSRVCQLTGTRANNGMAVSHSHIRTKKLQQANLQQRKLWWAEGKRWVTLRVTTRALKTIQKKGLGPYAKSLGIDLQKI